jgi:curved DNA-binding protein CbpA
MTRVEDLAVLELSEGVSPHEIRQKYKQLAHRDHPVKGGSKEAFQRLSNAYERLSWPKDESNGSEASERQDPARDFYSGADQDDFTSNFWYNEYYHFFQRRWNAGHENDGDRSYGYGDADDDYFDHWHEETRKAYVRERQDFFKRRRREDLKRGYDYRDSGVSKRDESERDEQCMFCGKHAPISKETADANGLNWNEYTAHPKGYKTCWNCKNNHVSVMSKSMALKKFAKKLDHSIFVSLRREGKSFCHRPVTNLTNRSTRSTEYFWYPDLEDRALAEGGWKPEVPWVRKDVSCERAVRAKKQMPNKRKQSTNSSAPEATKVTPEKKARRRRVLEDDDDDDDDEKIIGNSDMLVSESQEPATKQRYESHNETLVETEEDEESEQVLETQQAAPVKSQEDLHVQWNYASEIAAAAAASPGTAATTAAAAQANGTTSRKRRQYFDERIEWVNMDLVELGIVAVPRTADTPMLTMEKLWRHMASNSSMPGGKPPSRTESTTSELGGDSIRAMFLGGGD